MELNTCFCPPRNWPRPTTIAIIIKALHILLKAIIPV
jgi:hypothetical protein